MIAALGRVVPHAGHQLTGAGPARAATVLPVCRRSWKRSPANTDLLDDGRPPDELVDVAASVSTG